ncbi:hypothetical protein C8R43DRAFT_1132417 [Mycena crocata]|nr:hypothetical protein C8R43DRAFT_1132417 [Mycena crocata]
MDPLARDGERGWGGSWLPAFDWRARAGQGLNLGWILAACVRLEGAGRSRIQFGEGPLIPIPHESHHSRGMASGWGVELDHLRSTASAGSLTIYAGWWRASSFEDSAGPAKLCMDMVQLLQARSESRRDLILNRNANREHFLRQTLGTAPKLFFVSPAASTLLFARISAHREGPGPAAGRFVAGLRVREGSVRRLEFRLNISSYIFCLAILVLSLLHLELWHMRSFYRYTAKAFASIYIRSNYLPNDQTHYGQVFVTVRSGGTNDASLSLQPVDKDVPTTLHNLPCRQSRHTIDQENNSWEGVVERASIGLFRLHLVFASPSSLDASCSPSVLHPILQPSPSSPACSTEIPLANHHGGLPTYGHPARRAPSQRFFCIIAALSCDEMSAKCSSLVVCVPDGGALPGLEGIVVPTALHVGLEIFPAASG